MHTFWLGIHNVTDNGKFVYASDGTPVEKYDWADKQPDNSKDYGGLEEYGVEFHLSSRKWYTVKTRTESNRFVCVRYKKGKSYRVYKQIGPTNTARNPFY